MRPITVAAVGLTLLTAAACAGSPTAGIGISNLSRDGISLSISPFSYASSQDALAAALSVAQKHCREVAGKNARFLRQEPDPPLRPIAAHYACA